MKEIIFVTDDEDAALEERCPFCQAVLGEGHEHCPHVVYASGENIVNFIAPQLLEELIAKGYITGSQANPEYEEELFDLCAEILEKHPDIHPRLTRLERYFKFPEEDLEEVEGKWVHEMMEGPQDLTVLYLLPDFNLQPRDLYSEKKGDGHANS